MPHWCQSLFPVYDWIPYANSMEPAPITERFFVMIVKILSYKREVIQ